MRDALPARGDLAIDEATQQAAALTGTGEEAIQGIELHAETGRTLPVDPAFAEMLSHVVAHIALGGQASIVTVSERLTTSAAADMFGASVQQ